MKKLPTHRPLKAPAWRKKCATKISKLILPAYDPLDPFSTAKDALADLMHFAASRGWDFEDLLESSREHYRVETKYGETGEP